MIRPAPLYPTFTYPSACHPTSPRANTNANGACVLDTGTRDLSANLAELIRFVVSRSDAAETAASALGVTVAQLGPLARRHKVALPWSPPKKGGR